MQRNYPDSYERGQRHQEVANRDFADHGRDLVLLSRQQAEDWYREIAWWKEKLPGRDEHHREIIDRNIDYFEGRLSRLD